MARTFIILTWLVIGFATPSTLFAEQLQTNTTPQGIDLERIARIGPVLRRYVDDGNIPGFSVAVARRGRIVYRDMYGFQDLEQKIPITEDTMFRVYSISKPVTSTLAMILYEEGRFQISDAISKYMPEFAEPRIYSSGTKENFKTKPATRPITVRNLLTHTSGLSYGFMTGPDDVVDQLYAAERILSYLGGEVRVTPEKLAERIAAQPIRFNPGEAFHYGVSIDVLGLLLERVTGERLGDLMKDRIFDPLGMSNTGFWVPEEKMSKFGPNYFQDESGRLVVYQPAVGSPFASRPTVEAGGQGLVSTVDDYIKFGMMMSSNGVCNCDKNRLLSPKTIDLMMQNHLLLHKDHGPELSSLVPGFGFGYGGRVLLSTEITGELGSPGTWGWSGATSTELMVDRDEQIVLVLMMQFMDPFRYRFLDVITPLIYQSIQE